MHGPFSYIAVPKRFSTQNSVKIWQKKKKKKKKKKRKNKKKKKKKKKKKAVAKPSFNNVVYLFKSRKDLLLDIQSPEGWGQIYSIDLNS